MNCYPKYLKAQYGILDYIARNELSRGAKLPTEKEFCNILDVSVITLRQAVKNLEDQKLLQRMQGKGTFLKKDFKSLRTNYGTVGIFAVESSASSPGFPLPVNKINTELRKRGHSLKVFSFCDYPDPDTIKELTALSGIILTGKLTKEWVEHFTLLGIPFIVVGNYNFQMGTCQVRYNWEKAAELLVDEFRQCGYRKIALLNAGGNYAPADEIHKGFMKKIKKYNLPFDEKWEISGTPSENFSLIKNFINEFNLKSFDAIIAEAALVLPLMILNFYERGVGRGIPLGIISSAPVIHEYGICGKLYETSFPDLGMEIAVEALFEKISGKEQDKIYTIDPVLKYE